MPKTTLHVEVAGSVDIPFKSDYFKLDNFAALYQGGNDGGARLGPQLILALEHQPEGVRVQFDIGKNRFLRWQLGEEEAVTRNGLPSLMPILAPDQPTLDDKVLRALAAPDFVERFNQAAQHQGQIRGRPGETASLWVYPEFKLQTLVLVRAAQVNEHGNIGELTEERVQFPMPTMMHFVGVKQACVKHA